MTTTMVRFLSGGATYAIPVQATRGVRAADGIIALPTPAPDVAGIVPGNPTLTVITPLGSGGAQILVIEADNTTFGLLVEQVTGLRRIVDADIGGAPSGQDRALVSGTIAIDGQLVMIADAHALAQQL
jgi:chemotaxis signal transduction protein